MDRVENWKRFSEHMEKYIREQTIEKYGIQGSDSSGFDLMSITQNPLICTWHVLKYSLRIGNNKMKEHDFEKIAHYVELAWTMSGGEIIRNERMKNIKVSDEGYR